MMPDLLLVGLLTAMTRHPAGGLPSSREDHARQGWSLIPAVLAGGAAAILTSRHAGVVVFAYLGAGWMMQYLASHWDLTNRMTQIGALIGAELWITGVLLFCDRVPVSEWSVGWLESLWFVLCLLVRLATTVACFVYLRRVLRPRAPRFIE